MLPQLRCPNADIFWDNGREGGRIEGHSSGLIRGRLKSIYVIQAVDLRLLSPLSPRSFEDTRIG